MNAFFIQQYIYFILLQILLFAYIYKSISIMIEPFQKNEKEDNFNHESFESFSQGQNQNDSQLSQQQQQQLQQSTQAQNIYQQQKHKPSKFKFNQIKFPSPPQHFQSLYQIYKSNMQLIKDLRTQITSLKEIKMINQRLEYDQKNVDIQECFDVEEVSQFYVDTKKTYEERQAQIEKLKKQYKEINSQQLETLMLNDQVSKKIIDQYLQKNKQIIDCKCYKKFMVVLSLQKRMKRKKLLNMEVFNYANLSKRKSTDTKSIDINTPQKQQKSKSKIKDVDKLNRDKSNDKSQKSEDNQCKSKQSRKYVIRCIYYSQLIPSIKSQGPHILPIILPNHLNSQPVTISVDEQNKLFILLMNDNSIQYFQMSLQIKMVRSLYDMDVNLQPILLDQNQKVNFIESRNGLLYVGNTDGILRVYELQMTKTQNLVGYKLINIYGAFVLTESFNQITHYCFPEQNQNQVFFVGDECHLCSLNILAFRTQKIHTFQNQDKIVKIQSNFIKTTKNVFLNYCSGGTHKLILMNTDKWRLRFDHQRENLFKQASQGKIGLVVLSPEQKQKYQRIQKQERHKCQECKIIGVISDNSKQISIFNDQNGYFSGFPIIQSIQKHEMN